MRALTLRPDGAAAVAELADGDAALADVCRLLGCRRVEAVTFAADLVMWLDEDTRPAGDPAVNRAATLLGARFERGRVYVGSVVYTGGADLGGTPRGLSEERAAWLREQLNTLGVEVAPRRRRCVPAGSAHRAPGSSGAPRTAAARFTATAARLPPRGVPDAAVTDPAAVEDDPCGEGPCDDRT